MPPRGSAEGITVPAGDPDALRRSASQLQAVSERLAASQRRLAAMPSALTSWLGPGSSAFAQLSGQQASALQAPSFSALNASLQASLTADEVEAAQSKAWRAIERALEERKAINQAKADIKQAKADEQTARGEMAIAAATRDAARSQALGAVADVVTGGGAGAALSAAADAADREYQRAEKALQEAQRRERLAHGRLERAETELERARRAGHDAAESAQTAGSVMQGALIGAHGALVSPGAPAYGQVAAAAGIPRPKPPKTSVPVSQREPPSSWPGWAKSMFKIGRGEVTAVQGVWNLGRGAVEHPDRVPGAIWHFGEHTATDPLGTGKALIGYDELAAGRYEDWIGQMGIAALSGGAGGKFAGRRMDFGRADLGRRPGTPPSKLSAATRAALAGDYPKGVRFTRAGYPVLTPYAKETVHLEGLNGTNVDFRRADAEFHRAHTPEGYTWHHVEDGKTMELVPTPLHQKVAHTGSAAALKAGHLSPVSPGGALTPFERGLGRAGAGGGFAAGPFAAPPPPGSGP